MLRDAALAMLDREAVAAPAVEDMFAGLLALERTAGAEHHLNLLARLVGLPGSLDPAATARAILDHQQARPALGSRPRSRICSLPPAGARERLDRLSRNRRSFRTEARSD